MYNNIMVYCVPVLMSCKPHYQYLAHGSLLKDGDALERRPAADAGVGGFSDPPDTVTPGHSVLGFSDPPVTES